MTGSLLPGRRKTAFGLNPTCHTAWLTAKPDPFREAFEKPARPRTPSGNPPPLPAHRKGKACRRLASA